MKLSGRGLGLGLVVGIVGGLSLVRCVGIAAAEEPQASAKLPEARGKIVAVDPSKNIVTLEKEKSSTPTESVQTMSFRINEETMISKAGVRLQPADLQASDERTAIQYAAEGVLMFARTIIFEEPAGLLRASGTVQQFDVHKGELFVQPKGPLSGKDSKVFAFNERSVLSQGGVRTYLASLMAGDEVDIRYFKDGDTARVYSVIVAPRKGLSSGPLGF